VIDWVGYTTGLGGGPPPVPPPVVSEVVGGGHPGGRLAALALARRRRRKRRRSALEELRDEMVAAYGPAKGVEMFRHIVREGEPHAAAVMHQLVAQYGFDSARDVYSGKARNELGPFKGRRSRRS
jgi:hypothetical protein